MDDYLETVETRDNLDDGLAGVTLMALFDPSAGFPSIHKGYLRASLLIFVYLSWSFTILRSMVESSAACLLLDMRTSFWRRTMLSFWTNSSCPLQTGPYPKS